MVGSDTTKDVIFPTELFRSFVRPLTNPCDELRLKHRMLVEADFR